MDPVELTARDGEIPPRRRSRRHHHRVMGGEKHLDVDVATDLGIRAELGSLGLHLLEPPGEMTLLHLELRDAIAQETADPVGPLEYHDVVTGARQLLSRREAGWPATDDCDSLARLDARRLRRDPALRPS